MKTHQSLKIILTRGSASIFVLLYGIIASLFVGGMVMLTSSLYTSQVHTNANEQALGVAEAGASYYRWHLAHSPQDFTDGTGLPGPYVHEYRDPQGTAIGTYSLEVVPPQAGSTLITIRSTGWTQQSPGVKRTVEVTMGIPSMARYAFLHRNNVFFGSGVTIHGPAMSNGGVRMDGVNDSVVSSAMTTYLCGAESACSPPSVQPGVWGNGGPSSLWEFPVPAVDFDGISVAFTVMKTDAQAIGVYYGPSTNRGYHVKFLANGTADVYEVTQAKHKRGLGRDGKCTNLYQIIDKETLLGNHSLDTKHIFFFEDVVWVDGVVDGRVTVAAARFPIETNSIDMWINGNITYLEKDGSSQLGLISQRNIFFVLNIPEDFEINAALMAKNGSVFRHGFHVPSCSNNGNALRDTFTLYGSIISSEQAGWNWGTPPGSGFTQRILSYDNHLLYSPPPYFPSEATGEYEVVSWSETTR
jgi:hypothetical protein